MPKSMMNVQQVAEALHVSTREVHRMAEAGLLRAAKVSGEWQFRAGEVLNWIEKNLHGLSAHRAKDKHPETPPDMIIAPALRAESVAVDLGAKTKASVLRELAALAEKADPAVDGKSLLEAVLEREERGSTALQDGVAVPHPARVVYAEGPLIAAARTAGGVAFGEPGGGLSDLFFLVSCPNHVDHLLHLGRLCRLLIEKPLQERLRSAESSEEFVAAIHAAEVELCRAQPRKR